MPEPGDPLARIQEVAKSHGVAPSGMVVAVDRPMEIGEVLLVAGFRFAVTERLTREAFTRRVNENQERRLREEREFGFQFAARPGQGSFGMQAEASKPIAGTAQLSDAPGPHQKYFYAMGRLP